MTKFPPDALAREERHIREMTKRSRAGMVDHEATDATPSMDELARIMRGSGLPEVVDIGALRSRHMPPVKEPAE